MSTRTIPLREAGRWVSGGTPRRDEPAFWGGEVPWIGSKDLKTFDLISSSEFVTKEGAEAGSRVVEPGAVLFVTRGMSLANEFRVGVAGRRLAFNQDVKAIVPRPDLDGRYLARFLRSREAYVLDQCDTATHGTKRLPLERIDDMAVPLPPLPEQRRIADILDRAEGIHRKRQQAIALTDDLLRATFLDMFGDPIANPRGWPLIAMTGLVEGFRNGLSPSSTGDVHGCVLTLSSVTADHFDPTHSKEAFFDRQPDADQLTEDGTFLICRGNGNVNLVGRGKIARGAPRGTIFPDTIIACRPRPDTLHASYLAAVWDMPVVRHQIEAGARTTNGTYKVNQQVLAAIQIPVPPLTEQSRFARVESAIAERRRILTTVATDTACLFDGLVASAFSVDTRQHDPRA